jgi:hypothetical protein
VKRIAWATGVRLWVNGAKWCDLGAERERGRSWEIRVACLRCPLEGDDRQVPVSTEPLDAKLQVHAGCPAHLGMRRGARRPAWPVWPRLESRASARGRDTPISFLRGAAAEELMRAERVVPVRVECKAALKASPIQRDDSPTQELLLHAEDEPFDHGNAAVLADGTVAGVDLAATAPPLEACTPELAALVADDVLGPGPGAADSVVEELADLPTIGLLAEDRDAHDSPGEMVQDDGDPPGERP